MHPRTVKAKMGDGRMGRSCFIIGCLALNGQNKITPRQRMGCDGDYQSQFEQHVLSWIWIEQHVLITLNIQCVYSL